MLLCGNKPNCTFTKFWCIAIWFFHSSSFSSYWVSGKHGAIQSGKRFQVYDKLCEQGIKSKKPVTRYEIQLKEFKNKIDLESAFDAFNAIPKVRRYSCKKLKLKLKKLDYYVLKQLGVTALRSSLQTESEKRKLRRILEFAEKGEFGERLIGATRRELRAIQELLFNP